MTSSTAASLWRVCGDWGASPVDRVEELEIASHTRMHCTSGRLTAACDPAPRSPLRPPARSPNQQDAHWFSGGQGLSETARLRARNQPMPAAADEPEQTFEV